MYKCPNVGVHAFSAIHIRELVLVRIAGGINQILFRLILPYLQKALKHCKNNLKMSPEYPIYNYYNLVRLKTQ